MDRRTFSRHLAAAVVGSALAPGEALAAPTRDADRAVRRSRIEAVLFDAFPVFDPRPIATIAEQIAPGRGSELMTTWRTKQFEYAWLRVLSDDYVDFWQCTGHALRYAESVLHLELGAAQRRRLMDAWLDLRPWPDVPAALQALRSAGVRLGFLSNFSPAMLDACTKASRLDGVFEHALSTDRVRTYKPDPRAYQLGIEALHLRREQIVFVAFAGWDAAGAKRFGYPTFWVNRAQAPIEELGAPAPDGIGRSLTELVAFVNARR